MPQHSCEQAEINSEAGSGDIEEWWWSFGLRGWGGRRSLATGFQGSLGGLDIIHPVVWRTGGLDPATTGTVTSLAGQMSPTGGLEKTFSCREVYT